jgi:hypothetical protein
MHLYVGGMYIEMEFLNQFLTKKTRIFAQKTRLTKYRVHEFHLKEHLRGNSTHLSGSLQMLTRWEERGEGASGGRGRQLQVYMSYTPTVPVSAPASTPPSPSPASDPPAIPAHASLPAPVPAPAPVYAYSYAPGHVPNPVLVPVPVTAPDPVPVPAPDPCFGPDIGSGTATACS